MLGSDSEPNHLACGSKIRNRFDRLPRHSLGAFGIRVENWLKNTNEEVVLYYMKKMWCFIKYETT